MKRTIFILILILTFSSMIVSQDLYELRNAIDFYKTQKSFKGDWKDILSENDIKGSPYLNNEFINGSLFTTNKLQFIDLPLRYNIYNDQIEFKTESGQIQSVANPEIIESIAFDNRNMTYIPYLIENKIKKGFFIVLETGNVSLYAKPEVEFTKATLPIPFKDGEPAKFIKRPDNYYLRIGSEPAIYIAKTKDLIEVFPEKKSQIESFVKTNNFKMNNPDKLIELVKYLNSFN